LANVPARGKAITAAILTPREPDRPRSSVATTNGRLLLLYVVLSLILTGPIVWAGRVLLADSETLTFAVGNPNGEEARFAAKLAAVLHNTNSRLRLKIVTNADNAKALAQFDRREADLVVLRTDAKVPPRARALAILDHDLVLLLSPGAEDVQIVRRSSEAEEDRGLGRWRLERRRHPQYLQFCRHGRRRL